MEREIKELDTHYFVTSSKSTRTLSMIRRKSVQDWEIKTAMEDPKGIRHETYLLGIKYMHWNRIQEKLYKWKSLSPSA